MRARERLCAPDGAGSGGVVHHLHFAKRTSRLIPRQADARWRRGAQGPVEALPSAGLLGRGSQPRKRFAKVTARGLRRHKIEPIRSVMLLMSQAHALRGPPGCGAHIRLLEVLVSGAVRLAEVITGN